MAAAPGGCRHRRLTGHKRQPSASLRAVVYALALAAIPPSVRSAPRSTKGEAHDAHRALCYDRGMSKDDQSSPAGAIAAVAGAVVVTGGFIVPLLLLGGFVWLVVKMVRASREASERRRIQATERQRQAEERKKLEHRRHLEGRDLDASLRLTQLEALQKSIESRLAEAREKEASTLRRIESYRRKGGREREIAQQQQIVRGMRRVGEQRLKAMASVWTARNFLSFKKAIIVASRRAPDLSKLGQLEHDSADRTKVVSAHRASARSLRTYCQWLVTLSANLDRVTPAPLAWEGVSEKALTEVADARAMLIARLSSLHGEFDLRADRMETIADSFEAMVISAGDEAAVKELSRLGETLERALELQDEFEQYTETFGDSLAKSLASIEVDQLSSVSDSLRQSTISADAELAAYREVESWLDAMPRVSNPVEASLGASSARLASGREVERRIRFKREKA